MTSESPRHSVSVAAAILDDAGRVLVAQRRDNGHWEPPGGVLELAESIADGLRREVREETGLEIEPERLTGVYKNMARGIVALVFRARPTGGTLQPTGEAGAFRWVTPTELSELLDEAYAVRLLDALDLATSPVVREHDGVTLLSSARSSRDSSRMAGRGGS